MLDQLIAHSVRNKFVVVVVCLALSALGFLSFQDLPIDAVPDITNIQVQVNTPIEGLAPEEIERSITFPIENALRGIPFVEDMRSLSRFGLSQVTINFHEGADIYQARQLVSERLQTVLSQLPSGAHPNLGPVTTGLGEIFHYVLEAKDIKAGEARFAQLMEIRAVQEWFVKPRLMTVSGIAEVNTIGGYEKQYFIRPDPRRLAKYGIHIEDLISALERNNNNAGGGYVRRGTEQFLIQAVGLFKSPEDILKTPVKTLESLKTVLIQDIATVGMDRDLRTGAALVDGREAVVGSPMMRIGENSRVVADRVREKIGEIQKDLPSEYLIRPLYDRSELVDATLSTMTHNLVFGASLVVLVLLLMVGNLRAAFITAAVIPVTLLLTFIFMKRWNVSGNLMSLGALDFGILIDGTVIVMDNALRRLKEKSLSVGGVLSSQQLDDIVIQSTQEIRTAAGFGELVILVTFLPIFALTGTEGKMFTPMAIVFCIALGIAFVLSFTLVPALASLFLRGIGSAKESIVMSALSRGFARLQQGSLQYRKIILTTAILAGLAVPLLFARLGGEFLPELDEGHLVIQTLRPTNVSLEESIRLQEKTDQLVASFPEVKDVFSRIGTGEIATDPMGVNLADGFVMLKPLDQWPLVDGHRQTKAQLEEKILEKLKKEFPDQAYLMTQPIQMRFNDLLEGTRADVSLKIFGPDIKNLIAVGGRAKEVLETIPNAGEVEVDLREPSPILTITPKTEVLNRLGIPKADVLDAVSTHLGGTPAGYLFDGVRRFPLIVRLGWDSRNELSQIAQIPVGVGPNLTLPMGDLADISMKESYSTIVRENAERRVAVLMNPLTRDLESFTQQARAAVEKIELPAGVYVEWAGNFKNLERASQRLMVLLPITFFLILCMVYFVFRSWIETALIFLCVPMGVLGGILSLLIFKIPFSISAAVGFVALSGIAVLNGVVLVSFFNQLRREGKTGQSVIQQGTMLRLRPVLMTAFVDIIGFLPMMFATGLGSDLQRPLATVVIGGLVSSTLLTLVVLPLIYMRIEKYIPVGQTPKRTAH